MSNGAAEKLQRLLAEHKLVISFGRPQVVAAEDGSVIVRPTIVVEEVQTQAQEQQQSTLSTGE